MIGLLCGRLAVLLAAVKERAVIAISEVDVAVAGKCAVSTRGLINAIQRLGTGAHGAIVVLVSDLSVASEGARQQLRAAFSSVLVHCGSGFAFAAESGDRFLNVDRCVEFTCSSSYQVMRHFVKFYTEPGGATREEETALKECAVKFSTKVPDKTVCAAALRSYFKLFRSPVEALDNVDSFTSISRRLNAPSGLRRALITRNEPTRACTM